MEKIAGIEEEIRQLENRRKLLLQEQKAQERKDRTRRLCRRAALLESMAPDTVALTDEQFKSFLAQTIATEQGCHVLEGLAAQNGMKTGTQDKSMETEGNG